MDSTARRLIGPNNQPREKVFTLQKKVNYIDLKIGVANKGQPLGLEDVVNERNYTYSVRCIEEGTMYQVLDREFLHRVKKDDNIYKQVLQSCHELDEALKTKIQNSFKNIYDHRSPNKGLLNVNQLKASEITDYRAAFQKIVKK